MYEYIKGKVVVKKVDYVAIEINGIAYKIYISLTSFDNIKNDIEKLYIYTYVREDMIKHYGFYAEEEREFFQLLINSSGVGPKLAIAILSNYDSSELKEIIVNEDIKRLIKVSGLGIKKGQKLILDIKDKVKDRITSVNLKTEKNSLVLIKEELSLALLSLGYGEKEISKILTSEDIKKYNSIEEAIKDVLKKIHK